MLGMLGEMVGQSISLFNVEMVVIFIWLVYHDATLVRLKLEVADAVLLDVLHHIIVVSKKIGFKKLIH